MRRPRSEDPIENVMFYLMTPVNNINTIDNMVDDCNILVPSRELTFHSFQNEIELLRSEGMECKDSQLIDNIPMVNIPFWII